MSTWKVRELVSAICLRCRDNVPVNVTSGRDPLVMNCCLLCSELAIPDKRYKGELFSGGEFSVEFS